MYYLADDEKEMVLCCETEDMANHLEKCGCYFISKQEYDIKYRNYIQRIIPNVQLMMVKSALKEQQTKMLRGI